MKSLHLQFLQEELKRVSDWIKFSDKKTAFLAVYYSAAAGIIISNKCVITAKFFASNCWTLGLLYFGLFLIIITFLTGIFFLFCSIFPKLQNSYTDESLFYFGTVSKMKFVDFIKKLEDISEIEAEKQLAEQIYTNSLIADQKMKNVQKSTISLTILIFLVIMSFFL